MGYNEEKTQGWVPLVTINKRTGEPFSVLMAPEMTLSGVGRTATFHLVEVPPTPDGSRGGAPEEDPLAALPRRGARGSMDMGANLQRKLHKGRSKIFDALKIGR